MVLAFEFPSKRKPRSFFPQALALQVSGDKGKTQTLTAYIDEEEEWGRGPRFL